MINPIIINGIFTSNSFSDFYMEDRKNNVVDIRLNILNVNFEFVFSIFLLCFVLRYPTYHTLFTDHNGPSDSLLQGIQKRSRMYILGIYIYHFSPQRIFDCVLKLRFGQMHWSPLLHLNNFSGMSSLMFPQSTRPNRCIVAVVASI